MKITKKVDRIMKIEFRKLSVDDGIDVYEMLQHIDNNENEFKNPVKGISYTDYKEWLKQQDAWSREEMLPLGYVGQTTYWLFVDGVPVGYGKIRHDLTQASRQIGGNIGYAISSEHRKRGYGNIILERLKIEAYKMGIEERLLTVEKFNYASKKVIENNGGKLIEENDKRWYFII